MNDFTLYILEERVFKTQILNRILLLICLHFYVNTSYKRFRISTPFTLY